MEKTIFIPPKKQGFTNIKGTYFDKVREISYKKGELFGNLGHFILDTKPASDNYYEDTKNSTNGICLYQTFDNPKVAYRIYRAFADYKFNGHDDDILIQKLQEKQSNIKLSTFPTGVVTLDGYIIGQEIPYYEGYITINELFRKYKNFDPSKIYYAVIEILNELYSNGIIYKDNHSKNFLINPNDNNPKVEIIDFDNAYTNIDDNTNQGLDNMFGNYAIMVNYLNELYGITGKVDRFVTPENFDDAYKQLNVLKRSLSKG